MSSAKDSSGDLQRVADRDAELERLRALLAQAPDGIFVADLEGRYTDVNEAGCRLLGLTRSEILDKRITDLIPPEDVPRLMESREQLLRGKTHRGDWRLRRKDGSFVPVEVNAKILPDGRWQGFVRDISDRKELERELRLSEQRLRVALQASPAVVWTQDRELRYTWIHNPTDPFSSENVVGKSDFDLLPEGEAEQLARIKRGVLETGRGARHVVQTTLAGEPRHFDLTVEPLRDEGGRLVGITCAAWDVTHERRVQQEQRLLAELGKMLMSATPEYEATLMELARLAIDELADWFLIDVVEAGEVRRLRVSCSRSSKETLREAIESVPLDRDRPHLMYESLEHRRSLLVREVDRDFLESVAQSAEHFELLQALEMQSVITVPLVGHDHLLGAIAFIRSRGERGSYGERDLWLAEELGRLAAVAVENTQLYASAQRAIAARDEVLGIVAHDLRNPLNNIRLHLQILARQGAQKSQESIESAMRAVRRMSRLIQDMLDVAQLDAHALHIERVRVAARSLVNEAFEAAKEQASSAGLAARLEVAESLPDVCADRDRLLQVLDNLITNAVKFTPRGGEIVIGAEPCGEEVSFWVRDTGPGIAEDQVPRLFDRFWRGKPDDRRGAGLGLAIVRGIIEAHGGQVHVESHAGRGTTVSFTVPVA